MSSSSNKGISAAFSGVGRNSDRNSTNSSKWFASVRDGRLRVWDVASGSLCQEHVPDTNDDMYSCLSWGIQGKKSMPILALGLNRGDIVIYDVTAGEESTRFKDAKRGSVLAICFATSAVGHIMFSSTSNGSIMEWNTNAGKAKSKWKGDARAVSALCANNDGSRLVSGGRALKLWDTATHAILKTFTGHEHSVIQLSMASGFLISCAEEERFISVWNMEVDEDEMTGRIPVASFALPQSAVSIDALALSSSKKNHASSTIVVSAISEVGAVHLWRHDASSISSSSNGKKISKKSLAVQRNGSSSALRKRKKSGEDDDSSDDEDDGSSDEEESTVAANQKPQLPACSVLVESKGKKSCPIPILATCLSNEGTNILLARGSIVRPVFEQVGVSLTSNGDGKEVVIHRSGNSDALLLGTSPEELESNKKKQGRGVTVSKSESCSLSGPTDSASLASRRETKLTMADRLRIMRVEDDEKRDPDDGDDDDSDKKTKRVKAHGGMPTAQSMTHMLAQALHSGDKQLLEDCLNNSNETLVVNTVRRLPTAYVVPFLDAVVHRLQAKPNRGAMLIVWVQAVLRLHTAYLISQPDLKCTLSELYQVVDARLGVFNKLLRLSGRLDLIMAQITQQDDGDAANCDANTATTTLYEESDDEESDDDSDDDIEDLDMDAEEAAAMEESDDDYDVDDDSDDDE